MFRLGRVWGVQGGAGWEGLVNKAGALPQVLLQPPLPPAPLVEWGWSVAAGEGDLGKNGPAVSPTPGES